LLRNRKVREIDPVVRLLPYGGILYLGNEEEIEFAQVKVRDEHVK